MSLLLVTSCNDSDEDILTPLFDGEGILEKYNITIENNTLVFTDMQHFIEVENLINDDEIFKLKDETNFQVFIYDALLEKKSDVYLSLDLPYTKLGYLLNEDKIVKIGNEIHKYSREKVKIIKNGDWDLIKSVDNALAGENIFIGEIKLLDNSNLKRKSTITVDNRCNEDVIVGAGDVKSGSPAGTFSTNVLARMVFIDLGSNNVKETASVQVLPLLFPTGQTGSIAYSNLPKYASGSYIGISSTINFSYYEFSYFALSRIVYNYSGPSSAANSPDVWTTSGSTQLPSGDFIGCSVAY